MKISIDKEQLETLLKDRKSIINKTFKQCAPYFSFSLSLLLASFCSDFKDWGFLKANHVAAIYYSVIIISSIIGIYYLIAKLIKPYTYKKLYDEIIELSKPHSFAIMLIRNDTKHKFLLFKNSSWRGCNLFVNYNIDNIKKPKQNIEKLQKQLSEDFDITPEDIEISYCSSVVSRKWSYNDKTTKNYQFHFFLANISKIPNYMSQKSFAYKDNVYYWMSIEEMEKNRKIMKMNKDVVEIVKKLKINF